jgi:hypothetical protein
MNFVAARRFSSGLLGRILLQLHDSGFGLFVDQTCGAGFVVLRLCRGVKLASRSGGRSILRQIDLDEESDRILSGIAQEYHGDLGQALADLLQTHQTLEALVEECEEAHGDSLLAQKERADRGFREGRFTTWDDVRRRNNL